MECIFCKIVNGDVPSYKLYEDDKILAFLDITQGTKGHTLVIPKTHVSNIYEIKEDLSGYIHSKIPMIARALKQTFNPIGLNIINNNEKPLQSVFHYHVHLIPRYNDDGVNISTPNNYGNITDDEFKDLVTNIKLNIN
ncbi:HIT family protein [Candidatus Izimaplasma bacterium ZiA1]|uniref:HIT family protein n=1 Tax=Candidatus Izimoplasma sp. ZiA1 TaxID=2024899 RepID=UPI000BAA5C06|nr:HIT family protein [Candidatus Izimaplasma bacterium ZiA1]